MAPQLRPCRSWLGRETAETETDGPRPVPRGPPPTEAKHWHSLTFSLGRECQETRRNSQMAEDGKPDAGILLRTARSPSQSGELVRRGGPPTQCDPQTCWRHQFKGRCQALRRRMTCCWFRGHRQQAKMGQPLSTMALMMVLRRMGVVAMPHGFRSASVIGRLSRPACLREGRRSSTISYVGKQRRGGLPENRLFAEAAGNIRRLGDTLFNS